MYDLRTNMHFTLKQNPLRYEDLEDFVAAYEAEDRGKRAESERFKPFAYDELLQRDKVSLDLIWLRDESLEDSANLPPRRMCSRRRSSRTLKRRSASSRRLQRVSVRPRPDLRGRNERRCGRFDHSVIAIAV